ncbi:hypothetical protein [Sphingosinicella sp. BN140058]|uniref:hypothetical protein n=1 Tax=Sphingosinicella sp. BN140058 TaxID=1892855 RepID=UPI001011C587|nr:hypothetical protein [Sphingosinicella sp. BN140058]QAY77496.1 hypothetical protein ETR14_14025 [Sphingosinicella sp. BN140058]
MAEGSRGPQDAHAVKPPLVALGPVKLPDEGSRHQRPWTVSADDAEQGIQFASRLAGPVILLLALAGILYFIINVLI